MSGMEEALLWPATRLAEALEALARHAGLGPRTGAALKVPEAVAHGGDRVLGGWLEAAADALGVEAEPLEVRYPGLAALVRASGPALLRVKGEGEPRFLALVSGGRRAVLLGQDHGLHQVTGESVRARLGQADEAAILDDVDRMLALAEVPERRRARARRALLLERLRYRQMLGFWQLRPSQAASVWREAVRAGLPARLGGLLLAHAVEYGLWLLSWWMLGQGALRDQLEPGWLWGWGLLLLTLVPLRALVSWTSGMLAVDIGAFIKRRLLSGALRMQPDELRGKGAGQLFGRVVESQTAESLALGGGFLGLIALVELLMAATVLGAGAAASVHVPLLCVWLGAMLGVTVVYFARRSAWTAGRLEMTHELVERMVGHRTRLAQEPPGSWHEGEDRALAAYAASSRRLDRIQLALTVLAPRGWILLGILSLGPAFMGGGSSTAIAISMGGLLLVYRALRAVSVAMAYIAEAVIAWRQCLHLFRAAAREEPTAPAALSLAPTREDGTAPGALVDARHLTFRHPRRARPVLDNCSLRIQAGDRLLLQGPSGGGKSTLAALLAGLRVPDSGLLLLNGLDRHALGLDGWRRLTVAAPQFHENFVFTGTLAFNLLMGRQWPPSADDLREAEAMCSALHLDGLLRRMPAGLHQMVGETGWQLSHGERSRIFLARALLQGCSLVILDESFAALDPESLDRALRCALERAPTLLVIAHP